MSVLKAGDGGLPAWRQFAEMLALGACRRMGPGYYMQARFWRRSIPFRDKWRHAHQSEYLRYVEVLNPPGYLKASQHKVTEKAVLQLFGIPTAPFIGFLHRSRGCDTRGGALTSAESLDRLLRPHRERRVCFKAVEGYGGGSFAALDVCEHGGILELRHPITGAVYAVDEWWRRLSESDDGWIVEEHIDQHPALSALNADSVNTLRIWTLERGGQFHVVGAFLRTGRKGSQVDNTSRGGLACPIDLRTGRIREALDLSLARNSYERHPDSGAPIVGVLIPFWEECKLMAGRAVAAFPRIRFAGLDIAVTEKGPLVVELNVEPDRRGAAHLDLPHRDLFDALR